MSYKYGYVRFDGDKLTSIYIYPNGYEINDSWYSVLFKYDLQDNKFSIIYNLHDNDGGTEFKINNEVKFYKSEESTALLFPSKIEHRGVSPTKDLNRFSLNILIEI